MAGRTFAGWRRDFTSPDETTDLANGATTDLIAMTLPEFFAPTPETFLDFAIAAKPAPVKRESPWRKFLDMLQLMKPLPNPNPGETISPNAGAIRVRGSERLRQARRVPGGHDRRAGELCSRGLSCRAYVRCRRARRDAPWVRFSWQPVAGALNTNPEATRDDQYLQQELRDRLAQGLRAFTLMMAIGEVGDDFNDSSRPWPPHRVRVMMGMLTLNAIPEDQVANCEYLAFNPMTSDSGDRGIGRSGPARAPKTPTKSPPNAASELGCPFSGNVAEPAANGAGWFDRFVDSLPENAVVQFLSAKFLFPYWAWRTPTPPLPGGPRPTVQPSENVQRMMNLLMPLKDKSAIGRARAAMAIAENVDEIFAGLDNVGTVHFARFLLIGDYICMISVYDGDFTNYIRDFIATIGSVFDARRGLGRGRRGDHPFGGAHRGIHRLGART